MTQGEMNRSVELGWKETISITSIAIITKMFYTILPDTIRLEGSAAWYASALSCLFAGVFFYIILNLFRMYEGKNIIEIFQEVIGRIAGGVLGFLFYLYFLLYIAINVREVIKIIKVYNFPLTPLAVFLFVFLIAAVLVTYNGLYGVSKLSEFFLSFILLGVVAIFLLGIKQYDLNNLKPYGGYGLQNLFSYSLLRTSLFEDIFLLFLLVREVGGTKSVKRTGTISLLLSGAFIFVSMLCYLLVFNYETGGRKISGIIEIVKNAYFNQFFQRMESIFFLIMVIASAIAICIWFYLSTHLYATLFQIKDKRQILLPTFVIVFAVAMLPQSATEVITTFIIAIRQYSSILIFGVPILVWLIALLKRKRGGQLAKKET